MTSGVFRSIPIELIIVDRPSRQRRELVGIDELAQSIANTGLINPPVVTEDFVLVAGERRLTACKQLGWTTIPIQFSSQLSQSELHLIELEENVKRVDLSWQDECRAVLEYHRLRQSTEAGWTQTKTAKALGVKDSEVSAKMSVAEALNQGEPLVVNADRYSTALGIVNRKSARAKDSATSQIASMVLGTSVPATEVKVAVAAASPEEPLLPAVEDAMLEDLLESSPEKASLIIPMINADFAEWSRTYDGPKFNFLHCDFPYGINAGKHDMGAGQAFGGYDDSKDVYFDLLQTLANCMNNVVAESAHMMFWYSMDYYDATVDILEGMGWKVNRFPLIWHKSDNSGIMPDPKRGPRRIYETALLCSRGDRFVVQPVANLFSAPNIKEVHMSEKNVEMLSHFFRMFVDSSSIVLDPTMGSGNAIKAAVKAGAAQALGIERDPEFFDRAKTSYIQSLTTGL